MSPPAGRPVGLVRVAVVGAGTPQGTQLRAALARFGIPGSRVDLYASTGGEAVLSEYDGEARLIQEPNVGEIVAHEVIYLCESGELAERIAAAAVPGITVIDLVGALGEEARSATAGGPALVALPHPLALVISGLLRDLHERFGVEEALAVVLRPAADYGEEGLEELRDQTVRLLNFASVPTRTFGRQLAFNVLAGEGTDEGRRLAARISSDVRRLLGWERARLGVRLLTVPVFHGHCLQLRFRLRGAAALEEVREVLARSPGAECVPAEEPATPLEAAADSALHLAAPAEDGLGGFWLWAVAGDTGALGADRAVQLARELLGA